jgi:hypothetical protein
MPRLIQREAERQVVIGGVFVRKREVNQRLFRA